MTPQAEKRLTALQSLDTLGAGFQLASHDLDLRGAGNLLGEEQSGHIKEVGYELYQQMVQDAVERLKAGVEEPAQDLWSPTISLGSPVTIPESYIADLTMRLSLYRRLSALEDEAEIDAMGAEIVDRFGPPPPEVDLLLKLVRIKALCRRAHVEKLDAGAKGLTLAFRDNSFANPTGLVKWVTAQGSLARVRPDMRIVIVGDFEELKDRLEGALEGDARDREDRGEEGVAGRPVDSVMAGLVPAIHVVQLPANPKIVRPSHNVDDRASPVVTVGPMMPRFFSGFVVFQGVARRKISLGLAAAEPPLWTRSLTAWVPYGRRSESEAPSDRRAQRGSRLCNAEDFRFNLVILAHGQPRAPVLDLVGSTLPRPYHFRALIQSFQEVAAPFPGDFCRQPLAPRSRRPKRLGSKDRRSARGLLRRASRVENARLARRATRASRLPLGAGRAAGPWNGLAQNRDSFPIL